MLFYCLLFLLLQSGFSAILLHPLTLELSRTNIISSETQVRFQFMPSGGFPPYTLTYDDPPIGCIITEQYLFFPKSTKTIYYQVPLKIVLRDSSGMHRSTVIIITNGVNYFLDNTLYPYNLSLESGRLPELEDTLKLEQKVELIINESRKHYTIPYQSIEDIYEDLPNLDELSEIIASNNLLPLIKTVYSVPNTYLNCVQKVAYLSELNGRIITLKYQKQARLQRLLSHNSTLGSEMGERRKQLEGLLFKYQQIYSTYNYYFEKFNSLLENIVSLKLAKSHLQRKYDQNKPIIEGLRFDIVSHEGDSQKERTLEDLEQEQAQILERIAEINEEIRGLERESIGLQDKVDLLKKAYSVLEIEIEVLQGQVDEEQDQEVVDLKGSLRVIQESMPSLQEIINSEYYKCYGIQNQYSNLQPELTLNTFTYSDFTKYVRQLYNLSTPHNNPGPGSQVTLLNTNVVSSIWTENFGSAIPAVSSPLANVFSCLSSEGLASQTSIIGEIKGNIMEVWTGSRGIEYLMLGACTRIELNEQLPRPGSLAFWRGVASHGLKGQIYDVYFMLVL